MPTIDLATCVLHNSPDIRDWATTAKITRLEFRPRGVHVEHTKRDGAWCWPNFRPAGWDGDLQYTLWLFERIEGVWHGSGGIQFWQSCDENGGAPENFAAGWFYAADRWAPMTGYQPIPGETVGFLVTAGDARNNGTVTVRERSEMVVMPFPRSGDVWDAVPMPDPVVIPTPIPPPAPSEVPAWAADALLRLSAVEKAMDELGDPATLVHKGAQVEVNGVARFVGAVKSTGTVTTTG